MSRFLSVTLLVVLVSLTSAFLPAVRNFGNVATISTRENVKSDLKMMFGMFKSASSSASIPADKKVCVITGTTSGLGKETARALLNNGDYYVIGACRDVKKMNEVAEQEGFDMSRLGVFG
jgi:hypothetical protein